MTSRTQIGSWIGSAATVLGVSLAVAACGGSSSSSSKPASPASSSGSAAGISIATAKGPMGTYLTGASGRALYLWAADTAGKSSCSGACASTWIPLTTSGSPSASGAVKASALGTITRAGGAKQVTYNGHPLYYYSADTSAGQTTGEGTNSFGAKWWLVAPSGSGITRASTSSSAPKSSSSASSSGGSSSSSGGSGGSSSWG